MPFREKSAWISLLAHLVVFGGYFALLASTWRERAAQGPSVALLAAAVALFVLVMIVLNVAIALMSPRAASAPSDERERLIGLKSERIASYVLSTGIVCLIGALLIGWSGLLVANLLFAALVLSEIVKAVAQIAYYRAGVAA